MAKPFDATTKDLLEADPAAWLDYLGIHPLGPVEVIDSDLSTVSAEADKVYRVGGPEPYLVHVEMQATADLTLPRRLLRSNVLLDYRHDVRVWSVAVLLRPSADSPALTGSLSLRLPDGRAVHDFHSGIVRTWQQSAEAVLNGPLTLLPLALLADAPPEDAGRVVERIGERLRIETTAAKAAQLMKSTFLLAGLRYEDETIAQLLLGASPMFPFTEEIIRESSVGRRIIKMAGIRQARELLIKMGEVRLGPIPPEVRARLEQIDDMEPLKAAGIRLLDAHSWDELLAPEPSAGTAG